MAHLEGFEPPTAQIRSLALCPLSYRRVILNLLRVIVLTPMKVRDQCGGQRPKICGHYFSGATGCLYRLIGGSHFRYSFAYSAIWRVKGKYTLQVAAASTRSPVLKIGVRERFRSGLVSWRI